MTERATFAIGDVQGCAESLVQLVASLPFEPSRGDRLWFVGDLVNRGPESLAALRWIRRAVDDGSATTVLGNHDLHLLAVAAGVRELSTKDTFSDVFGAHDGRELVGWLLAQPLLHREGSRVLVHAGLLPAWSAERAAALAHEVSATLNDGDPRPLADRPADAWSDDLPPREHRATILAGLTRVRALHRDGRLALGYTGTLTDMPKDLVPWFEFPQRASADHEIVFGHWAALGLHLAEGIVATDTGCVWGHALTAVRLEDRAVFSQPRVESS